MRHLKNPQLHFGEVNIADIHIDARSRDDVPAILKGLQYIYTNDAARKKVFQTLEAIIDNVSALKPSVLAEINQVIVESGHEVAKKKPSETLRTRCDSFVVETDVHYPTDINVLWDAMRKTIELTGKACESENLDGWRQYHFNQKQLKKHYRKAQKIKHSTSKDEGKRAARCEEVHQTYREYLFEAKRLIEKSKITLKALNDLGKIYQVEQIMHYIQHAERQIDQIDRRVLKGDVIPHSEKVFSLFEEHTEWVCTKSRRHEAKGKQESLSN